MPPPVYTGRAAAAEPYYGTCFGCDTASCTVLIIGFSPSRYLRTAGPPFAVAAPLDFAGRGRNNVYPLEGGLFHAPAPLAPPAPVEDDSDDLGPARPAKRVRFAGGTEGECLSERSMTCNELMWLLPTRPFPRRRRLSMTLRLRQKRSGTSSPRHLLSSPITLGLTLGMINQYAVRYFIVASQLCNRPYKCLCGSLSSLHCVEHSV